MSTSQAALIHELLERIADLERENNMLATILATTTHQVEDLQFELHVVRSSQPVIDETGVQHAH